MRMPAVRNAVRRRVRQGVRQCAGTGQRDRGRAALEFVVIFPFFMLLIAAALQAALWFSARNAALASAQEGLRAARTQTGTPAAGRTAAADYASQVAGGQLNGASVQVSVGANQTITVRVTGTVPSFLPGVNLRVAQQASGPKERWVPPVRGFANSEGFSVGNPRLGGRYG